MRSWCFDSQATTVNGETTYDREYGSTEIREVIGKLIGNGVYAEPATNMQVVADSGLNIKVQPGCCWVKGAFGVADTEESLTLEASAGGRVDLIVARFDLSLSYRSIRLTVVKGTEGSATVPSLTRNNSIYDIQLAKINVRAGTASVLQSDITDTRYDATVCGIVTGVINQIDSTNLFAQYKAAFDAFLAELKDVLDQDTAGNLLNLINSHKNDTDAHITADERTSWNSKAAGNHGHTPGQVGLGNVANERQYSANNPPPGPHVQTVNVPGNGSSVYVYFEFVPSAVLISCTDLGGHTGVLTPKKDEGTPTLVYLYTSGGDYVTAEALDRDAKRIKIRNQTNSNSTSVTIIALR